MKTSSIKDYFYKCITLTSSVLPEEMKLTWKEREFLAECCYFNYIGGDLNDFSALSDYLLEIRFFEKKSDVSVYKTKVSNQKWIMSGRGKFVLPPDLDIKEGEEDKMKYSISLEYEHNKESRESNYIV